MKIIDTNKDKDKELLNNLRFSRKISEENIRPTSRLRERVRSKSMYADSSSGYYTNFGFSGRI